MITDYKIFVEKWKWETLPTVIVPTEFYFKPTAIIVGVWKYLYKNSSTNCVNLKYYGTENITVQVKITNDNTKSEIFISEEPGKHIININSHYTTHTFQNLKDAVDSYYSLDIMTAEINGSPLVSITGQCIDNLLVEASTVHNTSNLNYINFFSDEESEKIETIRLDDYLIDISDIEYSFENCDDYGTNKNLYYETSDVSMVCSGIYNNSYLKEFFMLTEDTTQYKWLLRIKKLDNTLVYKGIINQEGIEESFSNNSDSEQIKIQALGFEKEFKAYYSQESIEVDSCNIQFPYVQNQTGKWAVEWKYQTLDYVLKKNFPSPIINFNIEKEISEYNLINFPILKQTISGSLMGYETKALFLKTGLDLIRQAGKTKYEWLEKTCFCMGWKYFFYNDDFYLQNRTTTSEELTILDNNKIIEYSIGKSKSYFTFDNIYINDGIIWGGDDAGLGGDFRRSFFVLMSKDVFCPDTLKQWEYAKVNSLYGISNISLIFSNYYEWAGLQEMNDNNFVFVNYVWLPGGRKGMNTKSIGKNDILMIDGGDLGDSYNWTCDLSNTINHLKQSSDNSGTDAWFRGNYGWALWKIKDGKFYNYEEYRKSTTFSNNFEKFRSTKTSRKVTMKYLGIIYNPMTKFYIANDENINGIWSINNLKFSLKDDVTTMELQEVFE